MLEKHTRLNDIREKMKIEDWEGALKIAVRFDRLGEYKEAIQLAAGSFTNSSFYIQLGYDLDKLRNDGILALKQRFSKSWDDANQNKSRGK